MRPAYCGYPARLIVEFAQQILPDIIIVRATLGEWAGTYGAAFRALNHLSTP